jgi:hypothetical protein
MIETDMEQLIGQVAQRHGLLLSRDDPVLVSVTLNELILKDLLRQIDSSLDQAKQEIGALSVKQTETAKTIAEQLITAAAGYIADEVRAAAADVTTNPGSPSQPGSGPESTRLHQAAWLAVNAGVKTCQRSGEIVGH